MANGRAEKKIYNEITNTFLYIWEYIFHAIYAILYLQKWVIKQRPKCIVSVSIVICSYIKYMCTYVDDFRRYFRIYVCVWYFVLSYFPNGKKLKWKKSINQQGEHFF